MCSKPRISVVIPAYNAERTIIRTLESVFAQTFPPHEIIVVDDGSQDRTAEVVSQLAPRVRLIRQGNAGPAAARNHGIREATGEWIALLDSDDTWLPEKLQRQARELRPDVALVHCYIVEAVDEVDAELDFETLWRGNRIGTSSVILSKSAFNAVGGFNEDRRMMGVEDYNLWLRLAGAGLKIVTVKEPLSSYTRTETSLSLQTTRVIQAELRNVEVLAAQFCLPERMVAIKRAAILEEYAQALFWQRDLPMARRYYREILQLQPSSRVMLYWLATFVPAAVLNARRRAAVPSPVAESSRLVVS